MCVGCAVFNVKVGGNIGNSRRRAVYGARDCLKLGFRHPSRAVHYNIYIYMSDEPDKHEEDRTEGGTGVQGTGREDCKKCIY